jgi:hypothetical protein
MHIIIFSKVANLSLYAVALIVFSVVSGKTFANVENQVHIYTGNFMDLSNDRTFFEHTNFAPL